MTVKICPAAVMVPVRPGPVFGSTAYPKLPLPVPERPKVTCSQSGLLLTAVQAQAVPMAVTATAGGEAPVTGTLGLPVGEIENEQVCAPSGIATRASRNKPRRDPKPHCIRNLGREAAAHYTKMKSPCLWLQASTSAR